MRAVQLRTKPGLQLRQKRGLLYIHLQRGSPYRDFLVGGKDENSQPQTITTQTRTEAPMTQDLSSRSNLAGSDARSYRSGPPQGRGEREGERAGAEGRGAAVAPFPVAGRARSLQLQPLLPVAASSILVFFGSSILVLPKCPDPKQEVSTMEPSGPNRHQGRSAQWSLSGPLATRLLSPARASCRPPSTAGGVGAGPS